MSPTRDLDLLDLEQFATLSLDLLAIATRERLVWVSPRWTEVLGWSSTELLSQPFLAFVHPDDLAATVQEASRLQEGERAVQFLNRYRTKDGGFRWLEWNTSVAEDGRLYCITRDVTVRVEARQALTQRARLVEMAQHLLQVGHWYVDLAECTTFWSPEIYAIHGQNPETFTPSPERTIASYHPEDRSTVSETVARAVEFGEPFELEARIVRPTGEVRLVRTMGQAQRGPTGSISGVFGIVRDLTDDERVRRSQELEQFAHVASHDLRQPVRTIRQYLALLDEDYDLGLDEDGRTFWGFVTAAADRLDHLVRDLGRYTRACGNATTEPVGLDALARSVLERFEVDYASRGGHATIHGPLPEVLGNRARLYQVFEHLVQNALRFAGDAPPHLTVTGVPAPSSGTVTVVFSDQGCGFDPADGEKIFEPFRRLAHHDDEGTGIGLAIVRRMVQSMGGQVWAHGQPGHGASFFVRLPLAPRDRPTPFGTPDSRRD